MSESKTVPFGLIVCILAWFQVQSFGLDQFRFYKSVQFPIRRHLASFYTQDDVNCQCWTIPFQKRHCCCSYWFCNQSNLCIVTKNAPREICVWQTRKCTESNISCLRYQIPLLFQEIRDNNNNEKAIWNFFFSRGHCFICCLIFHVNQS